MQHRLITRVDTREGEDRQTMRPYRTESPITLRNVHHPIPLRIASPGPQPASTGDLLTLREQTLLQRLDVY
jgi:hypothetical protein